jgi:hypothetical protein
LAEADRLGHGALLLDFFGAPRLDRIATFVAQLAPDLRLFARLGERDQPQRSEAHVAQPTILAIAVDPRFCAIPPDQQI